MNRFKTIRACESTQVERSSSELTQSWRHKLIGAFLAHLSFAAFPGSRPLSVCTLASTARRKSTFGPQRRHDPTVQTPVLDNGRTTSGARRACCAE